MRFIVGEIYESNFNGVPRRVTVIGTADENREGTLEFLDNGEKFPANYTQIRFSKIWRLIESAPHQR